MEEKALQADKTNKSILERIIAVISVVSYFAACICVLLSGIEIEFFISISIAMVTSFCMEPLIEYIKEISKGEMKKNIPAALGLGFTTALISGILFIMYKTIFSQAIILDKNYYIYDCFAIFVLIYIIYIQIRKTVKKTKTLIIEKAGLPMYLCNIIWSIIVIFL